MNLYNESHALKNSMGYAIKAEIAGSHACCKLTREDSKENEAKSPYDHAHMSLAEIAQTMTEDAEEQAKYLNTIYSVLNHIIHKNNVAADHRSSNSSFEGPQVAFEVSNYVRRLSKYSEASPYCFVVALIYLERFQARFPSLLLTSTTLQRLLLVVVMTATKYLEDESCQSSHWAEIGGLSLKELNALELEFLFGMDFDLAVWPSDYARCVADLLCFADGLRAHGKAPLRRDSATTRRINDTCFLAADRRPDCAGEAAAAEREKECQSSGAAPAEATAAATFEATAVKSSGVGELRAPYGPATPRSE